MTSGITRRGGQLRRPLGSWSPAVHEYLRHLESVGFPGAPRVLAVEPECEVLTFLPGEVAADPAWQPGHGHRLPAHARTDQALRETAALIRDLHTAAANFRPEDTGYRYHPHPPRPGEIVSHGDLGPWNTVYRDGRPVAFIDWDAAQPVDPVVDLAAAIWAFVPLATPAQLREAGFDPVPDLPARLRLFLDAYGLADRRAILPALGQAALSTTERLRQWALSPADTAGTLEFVAGQLRWLGQITPELITAL